MIEGFVPWEALPETGGALDPPVRPLVAALNAPPWAHTVFSCAGHPEEPDAGARGRRQAHVDVLVADALAGLRAPGAPDGPGGQRGPQQAPPGGPAPGAPGVGLRGRRWPPPPWLRAACAGSTSGMAVPGGRRVAAAPAGLPDRRAGRGARWRYRRLVLEPVPYHLEPARCRVVLDAALDAARQALQPERERSGWAERARPSTRPPGAPVQEAGSGDGVEAEGHAPGEAVLALRLQGMELGPVQVAHQALQPQVAVEAGPADRFEGLLGGQQEGLGAIVLRVRIAFAVSFTGAKL